MCVWVCLCVMPAVCLISAAGEVKSGHKSPSKTQLSPLNLHNSWATSVSLLLTLSLCIILSLSIFHPWSVFIITFVGPKVELHWYGMIWFSTLVDNWSSDHAQIFNGTGRQKMEGQWRTRADLCLGLWFVWPQAHIRSTLEPTTEALVLTRRAFVPTKESLWLT